MPQKSAWFGPEYLEAGWAPAPRYLLRRDRIFHHLNNLPAGDVLEIGCASGALLSELDDRGFNCAGVETSEKALKIARQTGKSKSITFHAELEESWAGQFDYCLAFEVLEHIEHDEEALAQWVKLLRPGGKMLLSVPAHPRLWNARDVWSGHFRRYRREGLEAVFASAGMKVDRIECYGFPLANILELIFARNPRKDSEDGAGRAALTDKAAKTAESGIKRTADVKMFPYYTRVPGSWVMRLMIAIQKMFLNIGIGNGYFVVATKPA